MLLLGISSTAYTYAQGQPSNQFPGSIIAFSNTDRTPHQLELVAIQQGDAEPNVNEISLDITNTVSAQLNSQLLVFVTDSTIRVIEAKAKTATDQFIDLVPSTQANAFSLANLPAGVYTLDVITQKGNTKAAYEGILVIGQAPTNIQTIIEQKDDGDDDDRVFIFRDDSDDVPPDDVPPDASDDDSPDASDDAQPDD